jgi:hypothetical protein
VLVPHPDVELQHPSADLQVDGSAGLKETVRYVNTGEGLEIVLAGIVKSNSQNEVVECIDTHFEQRTTVK